MVDEKSWLSMTLIATFSSDFKVAVCSFTRFKFIACCLLHLHTFFHSFH